MDDAHTAPLLLRDIKELQTNLTLDGGDFRVVVPEDTLRGLLEPFSTRARMVIVSLLRGYSQRMAAATAGMSDEGVRLWGKAHPEFARAVREASNLGFSRTFERELHQRALAGPDDKGSMRALELVTKARAPEYREKQQIAMEVTHRAEIAMSGLVQGWSGDDAAPDSTQP